MAYSAEFRNKMIEKMAVPGGPGVAELAEQVGVAQSTLSRWLRDATTVGPVSKKDKKRPPKSPEARVSPQAASVPPTARAPRRPQDWPPEQRLRVLRESEGLDESELGAYLRREGLHESVLQQWRQLADEAALSALGGRRQLSADQRRVRELERELRRKEKALAEAAALLVLAKKARSLWGEEDESTSGSDER